MGGRVKIGKGFTIEGLLYVLGSACYFVLYNIVFLLACSECKKERSYFLNNTKSGSLFYRSRNGKLFSYIYFKVIYC